MKGWDKHILKVLLHVFPYSTRSCKCFSFHVHGFPPLDSLPWLDRVLFNSFFLSTCQIRWSLSTCLFAYLGYHLCEEFTDWDEAVIRNEGGTALGGLNVQRPLLFCLCRDFSGHGISSLLGIHLYDPYRDSLLPPASSQRKMDRAAHLQ